MTQGSFFVKIWTTNTSEEQVYQILRQVSGFFRGLRVPEKGFFAAIRLIFLLYVKWEYFRSGIYVIFKIPWDLLTVLDSVFWPKTEKRPIIES